MTENKNPGGFMGSVTVGEKGQIVIPKAVRDMFGIKAGDTLLLIANPESGIGIPPAEQTEKIIQQITASMLEQFGGNKENDFDKA